MRTGPPASILLALAATLAACGGSSEQPPGPAAEPADAPPATSQASRPSTPPPVTEPGTRATLTLAIGQDVALEYTLLLPDDYVPAREYPVLLGLPPGGQTQELVDVLLGRWLEAEARRRGWIVVSPAAPGELFFEGAARYLPVLVDAIRRWYPPEGGRVHVAGVSNGGLSAFRFALDHPELVASLVTFPGSPPEAADYGQLDRIAGIPVSLFVGGDDAGWLEASRRTASALEALGGDVSLTVVPGEGHVIGSLEPATLFDVLDAARR